jgi:tetratricopeptide (TPR) repeat protein
MSTKTLLITSVLSAFLLLLAVGVFSADISELLEQAETYQEKEQYEQAESTYLQIISNYPGTDYAFQAQKNLAILYVLWGKQPEADAAFQQLVADFYEHTGISQAVWQIAKEYEQTKKYDKALELYQYNVEHFPKDMYAMWSQVEIIYSLIESGDAAAADAACDKLITVFSEQETLPKEIHQVAMRFSGSGQNDRAYALHKYNVGHFPGYKGLDVIWSQSEMIRLDLQAGFYESACAGAEALLAWPPDQNDLPREIHVTAKRFAEAGKHDKAGELYRYNIEHFSGDMYAMWSQVEIVYSYIRDTNDIAATDAAVDKLLTVFSKQPTLPKEIYQIADVYGKAGRYDKAIQLHNYNVDNFPANQYAMLSQIDIVYSSCIRDTNDTAVDAAVDKLLTIFSGQPTLPERICEVAKKLDGAKKTEKALLLHWYNVDHFPTDMYAMWSQVEIVYFQIRDGNDAGADEAFDKLVTLFADQPTLPKEIYQVGDEYAKALNYDKAGALYHYVIANWPDTEYEMWARTGIVKLDIYLGNDANVQPALDELIADFNDQPALPEAVFVIGEQYYNQAFSDMNEGLSAEAAKNFQKTVAVWEKIIQQLPASAAYTPRFYYITAVVYSQELSQYTKGIEHYQRIVDDWPDYEFAWHAQYFIGMYYERLLKSGGIEESEALQKIEQSYIEVVENYTDSKSAPHAALDLGRINFNREQWIEAVYYFDLFLQKSDNNQALSCVVSPLGQAYEKMGETDTAAQLYVEFIETADPNDPLIKTISSSLAELTWTQN